MVNRFWVGPELPPEGVILTPEEKQKLHDSGLCRPCGFNFKADGCRNAEKCRFCHLCTSEAAGEEKKNWKRMKRAQTRKATAEEAEGGDVVAEAETST